MLLVVHWLAVCFLSQLRTSYRGFTYYPAQEFEKDFAASPLHADACAAARAATAIATAAASSADAVASAASSSSDSSAAADTATATSDVDIHGALKTGCFLHLLHHGMFFRDVIQVGGNDAGGAANLAAAATIGSVTPVDSCSSPDAMCIPPPVANPKFHYVRTRVQRCLVGDAGMTYRYSGVRLFAHPWIRPTAAASANRANEHEGAAAMDGTGDSVTHPPLIVPSLQLLHALNSHLRSVGRERLVQLAATPPAAAAPRISDDASAAHAAPDPEPEPTPDPAGADFNVALINYLDPRTHALPLRPEPYYGMGVLAVGWHRDESLEALSSIAVYHSSEEVDPRKQESGAEEYWHIGLKRAWDIVTPAVRHALLSGDSYFMLHQLNTTHQHAVLAGTGKRFSSTHRKAITHGQTLDYISARCAAATEHEWGEACLPRTSSEGRALVRRAALLLSVWSEVEMEWIRQFWMQGRRHAAMHSYFWRPHLEQMEQQWRSMQQSVAWIYSALANYFFSQPLVNDDDKDSGAKQQPQPATTAASAASDSNDDGDDAPSELSSSPPAAAIDLPLCRLLLASFRNAQVLRAQWHNRYEQDVYYTRPEQRQPNHQAQHAADSDPDTEDEPVVRPEFGAEEPLPLDLAQHIQHLQLWQTEFERNAAV